MRTKRHAKPTTAQLVARIYRRQIELSEQLAALNDSLVVFEGLRVKQDAQLDRLIANQSRMLKHVDNFAYRLTLEDVRGADRFMAAPMRARA